MTRIGNAYRWVHSHLATRPTNYSWVIKDMLAGSGIPRTYSQFRWVLEHGIATIITVREVPLPAQWLTNNINQYINNNGNKLEYLHLKVEDYGAPSLEQLDITINFMKRQIVEGKPVMVHCAAGKGRTGTILAAYLLKEEENLDAGKAIMRIRKLRPGSVQSETQKKCIESYENYIKKRPSSL
ncbi:MAG TPA: dual specificity protein phosphatase family protein [Candidatus Nitrosopolaris sp.]|nr:dual specificity protein phosphatase family protein [Candidatus Nitrosopolaris sp.]